MTRTKTVLSSLALTLALPVSTQAQAPLDDLVPNLFSAPRGDEVAPKISRLRAEGPDEHWLTVRFRSSEQADATITVEGLRRGKYQRVKRDRIWAQRGANAHALEVGKRAQYRVTVSLRDKAGNASSRRVAAPAKGR